MDLVPPVMPGQKSTYTPVQKTGTTSGIDLIDSLKQSVSVRIVTPKLERKSAVRGG
jgi:hypothetical protein